MCNIFYLESGLLGSLPKINKHQVYWALLVSPVQLVLIYAATNSLCGLLNSPKVSFMHSWILFEGSHDCKVYKRLLGQILTDRNIIRDNIVNLSRPEDFPVQETFVTNKLYRCSVCFRMNTSIIAYCAKKRKYHKVSVQPYNFDLWPFASEKILKRVQKRLKIKIIHP